MSLFGSLLGDFDDDFMGNHMNAMNMQMRSMNRLMNSLMPDPFNMLAPFDHGMQQNSLMERQHNPMGGIFGFPAMPNINRLLNADIGNTNGTSFCSSSVMTMTAGPDGRPQIYQASTSTKSGPGGIRETRKTVQDSRRGIKKMAIGHHIGDRAHIIEKEQDLTSGQLEERQEFINLDEEEAPDFDREFTTKAHGHGAHIRPREVLTIEDVDDDEAAGRYGRHGRHGRRQLPALPEPPSQGNNSSDTTTQPTTATTTTTATDSGTAKKSSSSASASASASTSASSLKPSIATTSRANINAIDAINYKNNNNNYVSSPRRTYRSSHLVGATPRRPLRTPLSSPLATTPTNHSHSTAASLSVHPHPYNASAARRNHRSKHTQQHQQPHPVVEFPDSDDDEPTVVEENPSPSSSKKKHSKRH